MDLAAPVLKPHARAADRVLLGVYERVGRAVEHKVAKQAQREAAADALVRLGQVRHAVAQRHERRDDLALVHEVREPMAGGGVLGRGREAREERVRALVAKDEGQEILLVADDALGQEGRGLLAKEVMGYQSRHVRSRKRESCSQRV